MIKISWNFDSFCLNSPYFDNSYENADVAYHLDWRTAVEIIEDGGDYYGAEAYEKLHPKLFITLEEEKLTMKKLSAFLETVHLKSTMEKPWQLSLETLAIKSGKIITNVTGNA